MFGVGRGMLIGLRGGFRGINGDFYWLEETLTVKETNPFDDPDKILDRKNDASSSEADDSEDLYYDPKDDEGFDENEHILQDVHLDVINYDSFSSDTDDGIDLERRDKLRELRRIGKAKNHGLNKVYLMKRIIVFQKVIVKTGGPLTPTVTAIFDAIKSAASQYNVE
ncbi:hypothetical protein Tco_1377743 [Tanacetum coccineum]